MSDFRLLSGIAEVDRSKWEEFSASHPYGSVFQSPVMFDHYATIETYKPLIYAAEDSAGVYQIILLAIVIRDYQGLLGKFSTRTLIIGGPLIDPNLRQPEAICLQLLNKLIHDVKHESLYIQIRNLHDVSLYEPIFRKAGFLKMDHLDLIVQTDNAQITKAGISKSKIRQARQSLKSGAFVQIADQPEEIRKLYELLKKMYKYKIRKPLPPLSFFLSFLDSSKQGKLGIIFLAKYQGEIVGGMVCPVTPSKSLFEWYICGMDKDFRNVHPSVLLTYTAIEYATNNGFRFFDFMGIGNPDIPYGVREFKSKFGGKTVNYGRFLLVNNKPVYFLASMGYVVLRFLKLITFQRLAKKNIG